MPCGAVCHTGNRKKLPIASYSPCVPRGTARQICNHEPYRLFPCMLVDILCVCPPPPGGNPHFAGTHQGGLLGRFRYCTPQFFSQCIMSVQKSTLAKNPLPNESFKIVLLPEDFCRDGLFHLGFRLTAHRASFFNFYFSWRQQNTNEFFLKLILTISWKMQG